MSTRAIDIEAIDTLAASPLTRAEWNRLVAASESNTVFQTHEWLASWCAVSATHRPLLLLGRIDGVPIGIAPLARAGRTLRFAADHHADYCDVIVAPAHKDRFLRAVLQYLADRRADWDALSLLNIPDRSSTLTLLRRHARRLGLHVLVRGTVPCPTILLGAYPDPRRALLRKDSLQRPYRFFARSGALQFRDIATLDEARALLPRFFAQHEARWRDTATPSLFHDADNRRFYEILLEEMWPSGWLVFSVLTYNDAPIAFHLGFDYDNCFLWYKPSFDVQLRRHSPGNVMLHQLLARGLDTGKAEFDFSVGDEAFKRRYCNATRYNRNLVVTHRTHAVAAARVTLGVKRILRPLWKAGS